MLRSDLCGYSDTYIVVKRIITADGTNDPNKRSKKIAFENNPPFIPFISKINRHLHTQCRRSLYCYTNVKFARIWCDNYSSGNRKCG